MYKHINLFINVYIHLHFHIQIYIQTYSYICTYIRIHTYTHTHTHTHTHTNKLSLSHTHAPFGIVEALYNEHMRDVVILFGTHCKRIVCDLLQFVNLKQKFSTVRKIQFLKIQLYDHTM